MKIAVNTRLLLKNKLEGIGWFTYNSIKRIVESHPEHDFFFLFDRKYDERFVFGKNVTPLVIGPQARHPVLHYIWFEHSVTGALKKINPDIFISPDAYCSLKTKTKTLLVIHDLNFEHYPEHMPWLVRKYYKHYTPLFAHRADRIATVSNYSKQDIVKQYQVDADKIDVVRNGANQNFKPLEEQEKKIIRETLAGGDEYFIFIGALNPRKNLINLFKAFDIYKKKFANGTKLLVVGEKMWSKGNFKTTYEQMKFKEDVIFSGRLRSEELSKAVGAALALTYVSYFEGFGIPIIEAFNTDTPVITSNVTSMPEVAGDAALLVDPFNPEEISMAMQKVATSQKIREELISKGRLQRQKFSWEQTAGKLWQSVLKVVE